MGKLSLAVRIAVIAAIPMFCALALVLVFLVTEQNAVTEATSLESQIQVVTAASRVVHETQIERGKTAGYLGGGLPIQDLNEHRKVNDSKISILEEKLSASSFDRAQKDKILATVEGLRKLRAKVSNDEISLPNAIKTYSKTIASLLDLSTLVASNSTVAAMTSKLVELRILEDPKEAGGKLRAKVTGILAEGKPIDKKTLVSLVQLKAKILAGLSSPGLQRDESTDQLVSKFLTSNNWKTTESAFQNVLENAETGKFDHEAKSFFSTITGALNILGQLVEYKRSVIQDEVDTIKKQKTSNLIQVTILSLIACLLVSFAIFVISRKMTREILDVVSRLTESTSQVSQFSRELQDMSQRLNHSSIEQSSAIQETVTSIDQISSMVQRSSNSASTSKNKSSQSKNAAENGRQRIDSVVKSIDEVVENNNHLKNEMTASNQEMTKIVELIVEIGQKTKVINDIVFQTKLLSFNASVEAARAGEHGKGFAVVAEEVGNLASMSGKAAQEIREMLDESTAQVTDIVERSKHKLDNLIKSSQEKVKNSIKIAHSCESSLEEIITNVNSVNESIVDIARACEEQSLGIKEVTRAMATLDRTATENSDAAKSTSTTATSLSEQSQNLGAVVNHLANIAKGQGRRISSKQSDQPSDIDEQTIDQIHGQKPSDQGRVDKLAS